VTKVAFSVEPSTGDKGMLDAVDVDPEGDHAGVLTEVHAINHQRHQIQRGQVRRWQVWPRDGRTGAWRAML
jgi:hypothetical protein